MDIMNDMQEFLNRRHCDICIRTKKRKDRASCREYFEVGWLVNRIERESNGYNNKESSRVVKAVQGR